MSNSVQYKPVVSERSLDLTPFSDETRIAYFTSIVIITHVLGKDKMMQTLQEKGLTLK